MKKIAMGLSAILLLTACGDKSDSEENPEANNPSENVEEVTENDGNSNDGSPDDDATNDGTTNDGASNDGATNDGASNDSASNDGTSNNASSNDVEGQEITFVPQKSDLDSGLTIENDETLAKLNDLVDNAEYSEIGLENDVGIQYTGLYFNINDNLQPIFLLTNKTDKAFTNINMAVSFGATDGRMIFEEEGFHLAEDKFGVLNPGTTMPLYLGAESSLLDLLQEISQTRDETISIDHFDYETVDVDF